MTALCMSVRLRNTVQCEHESRAATARPGTAGSMQLSRMDKRATEQRPRTIVRCARAAPHPRRHHTAGSEHGAGHSGRIEYCSAPGSRGSSTHDSSRMTRGTKSCMCAHRGPSKQRVESGQCLPCCRPIVRWAGGSAVTNSACSQWHMLDHPCVAERHRDGRHAPLASLSCVDDGAGCYYYDCCCCCCCCCYCGCCRCC